MREAYRSSTIQRALDVLNLFKDNSGLSLLEIRKKLKANKSTVYRVLSTLEDNKFLNRGGGGKYKLGINVFILGHRISKESHLINAATPLMNDLSRKLGLTAHLGALEGANVVLMQKIEPDRPLKMVCQVGGYLPAHCTSLGKTLLAYSSREEVQKLIDMHGLQRYTPETICTTKSLMAELDAVREKGYALDDGEHEKHIRCVAVPILNAGAIEGALGAAGTVMDLPDQESVDRTVHALFRARDRISAEMGYEKS
ncbi:MAG TPA: IclR family transcriptional regulator [Thermodesulfobacteriota bacterium]|nr:IclR family transcriptional regulator [Thermodesulfobacteriota bacterium]